MKKIYIIAFFVVFGIIQLASSIYHYNNPVFYDDAFIGMRVAANFAHGLGLYLSLLHLCG